MPAYAEAATLDETGPRRAPVVKHLDYTDACARLRIGRRQG